MANEGSVPIPTNSPSSRTSFEWSAASSAPVVHRCPSGGTYWRGSVQIGHDGGGESASGNWVPQVTQMNLSMSRTLRAARDAIAEAWRS
jgi:hypothetical protein